MAGADSRVIEAGEVENDAGMDGIEVLAADVGRGGMLSSLIESGSSPRSRHPSEPLTPAHLGRWKWKGQKCFVVMSRERKR